MMLSCPSCKSCNPVVNFLMSTHVTELFERASILSEKDRATLAGLLIESLESEVDPDVEWYAERNALAARAFVHELSHVVRLAVRSPQTWPRTFGNARRRRRPSYWTNR